jgi:phage baseplate assembly protein W
MTIKKLTIKPSSNQVANYGISTTHIYKGFTSSRPSQNFKIYDFECIRQDLLNQFNTRKGERVMNPEFGTVIWDAIFEPLTESTKNAIVEDIRRILNSEPRIEPEAVKVDEYSSGILLELTVRYKVTNQSTNLKLSFDREIGLISS